jgi:hypothetical protein
MKRLLFSLLLITAIVLSGCTKSTMENETHTKTKISHPLQKVSETKKHSYQSINEYHGMITGQNLKTGILHITKKDNTLTLDMDFKLSDKLKRIMMNTKNKFYLTFSEVEGQHNLDNLIAENPKIVEGSLDILYSGTNYHLTQIIKIKENATPEEIKIATTPANYELVFLNENYQKVAVVIGLDLSTF